MTPAPAPSERDHLAAADIIRATKMHDVAGMRLRIAQALAAARAEGAEAERMACHDEAVDVARHYANFSQDKRLCDLAGGIAHIVRARITARGPLGPEAEKE